MSRRHESGGSSCVVRRWMWIMASLHRSAALPCGTVLSAARSADATLPAMHTPAQRSGSQSRFIQGFTTTTIWVKLMSGV
jgi:hypothetical protein